MTRDGSFLHFCPITSPLPPLSPSRVTPLPVPSVKGNNLITTTHKKFITEHASGRHRSALHQRGPSLIDLALLMRSDPSILVELCVQPQVLEAACMMRPSLQEPARLQSSKLSSCMRNLQKHQARGIYPCIEHGYSEPCTAQDWHATHHVDPTSRLNGRYATCPVPQR